MIGQIETPIAALQGWQHPVVLGITSAIVVGLLLATVLIRVFQQTKQIDRDTYHELVLRVGSWYFLSAVMVLPILIGPRAVWLFFLLLALFCFREFSKATGLNHSMTEMCTVMLGICVTFFAILDHWMDMFTTTWAITICVIFLTALLADKPQGYIRRVSLSFIGFALFGISLGHLAFISNDCLFQPILLWILFCTALNDVFAYLCGKKFGKRKLLVNTSPNKTWAGAIGATLLTTTLAAVIGYFIFHDSPLAAPHHLVALGLIISVLGQCGDLVISSIKRDLNIKNMASLIPGHGGLLDRFDSLLLAAPVLFHYINYFRGIGMDQPVRAITGQ